MDFVYYQSVGLENVAVLEPAACDTCGDDDHVPRRRFGRRLALSVDHTNAELGAEYRFSHRAYREGLASAGSGDYRNFFEVDGKRYSHEINPRTGRPIDHALTAVTVLAATCAEADAWATAMMVLGPVDGPLLANQRGMAVYFIIRKDQGWESSHTPAFEPYLGK